MTEFNIPLNASNYVSEERKKAFQEALEDGHQVSLSREKTSQAQDARLSPTKSHAQNRKSQEHAPEMTPSKPLFDLIHSIEKGLEHAHAHQNRTLDVHQQFLDQQTDYARVFSEVMNQQRTLIENQNGNLTEILDSIHNSLEKFHDIQERGLEVHQRFLDQQADYARSFVDLLQEQHQTLSGSNGKVEPGAISSPSSGPNRQRAEYPVEAEKQGSSPERAQPVGSPAREVKPEPQENKSGFEEEEPSQPDSGDEQAAPAVSLAELSDTLLEIVGEKTGYPPDMLELEMDMEADLGIDSIKRVEILGALEDAYPELPQADTSQLAELRTLGEIVEYMDEMASKSKTLTSSPDETKQDAAQSESPQPAASTKETPADQDLQQRDSSGRTAGDVGELSEMLLEVVGEKTGYPPDMLELEMDMEADLGIDSIKRVEILGAMEDQAQDLPPFETETLAELRTLGQVVDYMVSVRQRNGQEGSTQEVKKKGAERSIDVNAVKLSPLPPPDTLDLEPPSGRPLLVSDDGSALSGQLAARLRQQGWKVVLLRYPPALVPSLNGSPADIPQIQLGSVEDGAIAEELERLRQQHGPPVGLIHIHPNPADLDEGVERSLVKSVFFLAKHLQQDLTQPPEGGRTCFCTVTQTDGALGLQNGRAFSQGSGLPGLTKTLRWEWSNVFCRAVDLGPDRGVEENSRALLGEMFDADLQHIEVGYGEHGRVTISQEKGNL